MPPPLTKRQGLDSDGGWVAGTNSIDSHHRDGVVGEWLESHELIGGDSRERDTPLRDTVIVAGGCIVDPGTVNGLPTIKPKAPHDGDGSRGYSCGS